MTGKQGQVQGLVFILGMMCLCACDTLPTKPASNTIKLSQVLDQISFSLKRAYAMNGNHGPKVTSIQMNMQVSDMIDGKGTAPSLIIVPTVQTSNTHTHSMSFTFVPQIDRNPASDYIAGPDENNPLAQAVSTAFQSMSEAQNLTENRRDYILQNGSMQLQLAIMVGVGLNAKIPLLTPIQISADTTNQVTHTLVLNFAAEDVVAKPGTPGQPTTGPTLPSKAQAQPVTAPGSAGLPKSSGVVSEDTH